jgi:DNA-binding transcriptional regulator YhcF (GntR family)
MHKFKFTYDHRFSKVQQIAHTIASDIEKGVVKQGYHLPSINEFSREYNVARDTIEKAYKSLKKNGYISSVSGKGYFVNGRKDKRIKVLLVFNRLCSFKKIIYDALLEALGKEAKVDLHIHHYDPKILKEIALGSMTIMSSCLISFLTQKKKSILKSCR